MTTINTGLQTIFPRLHQKAFHFEAPFFQFVRGATPPCSWFPRTKKTNLLLDWIPIEKCCYFCWNARHRGIAGSQIAAVLFYCYSAGQECSIERVLWCVIISCRYGSRKLQEKCRSAQGKGKGWQRKRGGEIKAIGQQRQNCCQEGR